MVLVAFAVGLVAAVALWAALAPAFAGPVFQRENFRGRALPTAAGLVIVIVAVAAAAVVVLADAAGARPDGELVSGLRLVTFVAVGFGLLGLLDDLAGTGESGGFAGHLRTLGSGRLTTGAVKLFGGAALAVVVVATAHPDASLGRVLADGALVALAANLGNLFDRAPARTIKVTLMGLAALIVTAGLEPELAGVALVVGAGAGLLSADLREQLMLGDTGANVLGAALGLGVVLTASLGVRTGVLVALILLNVASERVSFSRVINATPPLRAFDRLGRMP